MNFLIAITILTALLGFFPNAKADKRLLPLAESLQEGAVVPATVDHLYPTQPSLGYQWFKAKVEKLKSFGNGESGKTKRHEYLLKNPIPVVVGPGGKLFIVDHHHLARAVLESGHSKLYIKVIRNYSADNPTKSEEERLKLFWKKMVKRSFAYLYDDINDRPLSFWELPTHLSQMINDNFRSLAGLIRDAKKTPGFTKKEGDYFVEFQWSRALRKYFQRIGYLAQEDFWTANDTQVALNFAYSMEAQGLPGYLGDSCLILFK